MHQMAFHPLNILGVFGFIALAWIFSQNRKAINWRLVASGIAIQVVIALVVLQPKVQEYVFKPIDGFVQSLLGFSKDGANFVMMSVSDHRQWEYVPGQYFLSSRLDSFQAQAGSISVAGRTLTLKGGESLEEVGRLIDSNLGDDVRAFVKENRLHIIRQGKGDSARIDLKDITGTNVATLSEPSFRSEAGVLVAGSVNVTLDAGENLAAVGAKIQAAGAGALEAEIANNQLRVFAMEAKGDQKVRAEVPLVLKDQTGANAATIKSLMPLLTVNGTPGMGVMGVPALKHVVGRTNPAAMTFAFWILPTVIFFSSIMSLLYYFGVMQPVVNVIAIVVQKIMGTSGAETLSCSANIFMGQTEAPLVIKPFVANMTKSELHAVMVGGFGTVAGGVLAMYAAVLQGIPGIAGHLVTASCMAAPGSLVISKILFPETEESETMGGIKSKIEILDGNAIEAASRGASEGTQLVINIVGMLIAFVALVAMIDAFCVKTISITFTQLLGYLFTPLAFMMGVPSNELVLVGQLLGKKVVLTELIAYLDLSGMVQGGTISARSQLLCSYALCGFANFASIGIQIGGIGGIAPNRKADLAQLGLSAMFGGMIVTCCTATIAGIFIA